MSEVLIVGGGIAGLTIAKQLKAKGTKVSGLEKEARLGGRLGVGHHRLYSDSARDLLAELSSDISWEKVDEEPVQLRKGEAGAVGDELNPAEQLFLGRSFHQPEKPFAEILDRLVVECGDDFLLRKTVTEVSIDKKEVVCLSGETFPFSQLIWTASFASLLKACGKSPEGIGKRSKKEEAFDAGGLTWDILTDQTPFTGKNTLVFPFRYKDSRLRALGMQGGAESQTDRLYHWTLFLEDALLENREELAKVVRTFKRELFKQFPSLESGIKRERLVFHPSLVDDVPVPVASLEVFPGIVCVGGDTQTEAVSPTAERHTVRNLDAVLLNCIDFVDLILPQWSRPVEGAKLETASEAPVNS